MPSIEPIAGSTSHNINVLNMGKEKALQSSRRHQSKPIDNFGSIHSFRANMEKTAYQASIGDRSQRFSTQLEQVPNYYSNHQGRSQLASLAASGNKPPGLFESQHMH